MNKSFQLFHIKTLLVFFGFILFFFTGSLALAKMPETISYTESGTGEPLVLIHAFPTDQRLWAAQQKGLKPYFHVITLDLEGFGRSSATHGQAITMTEYADQVQHLLKKLKIKKAIIGGESMGGYIALAFLKKYPKRVNGLVLSNTQSIPDSPEQKIKREVTAREVLKQGTREFVTGFLAKALSPKATSQTRTFLHDIVTAQAPTAVASALRGMALREDTSAVLSTSALPILILTGDQDHIISPNQSQNMHRLAKNSRLIQIAKAGHLSNLEQSKQWNKAVIEMFYNYKL